MGVEGTIDIDLTEVEADQEAWRATVARGLVSLQAVVGTSIALYTLVWHDEFGRFGLLPFAALFWAAAIPKNLSFRFRALLFIAGNVSLGAYAQLLVGFDSGPSLGFALALVAAAALLGTRAALIVLAISFATFVLTPLAISAGWLDAPVRDSAASVSDWIGTGVVYAGIGAIFIVTVRYVIRRIETTLADRTVVLRALEREREDRDRVEGERDRAEAALEQARKLEALGRLAGGVAHDFNNALQVILAWADLLRSGALSEKERDQALADIERSGTAAAQLTRKLLSFGRREVRAPRALEVRATLDAAAQTLKSVLPDDIAVEAVAEGDLPSIHMDEAQLDQVLLNLGINARDAMPSGGKLTLRAEAVTRESGLSPEGPCVALSIRDTGSGMDKETAEHVFEPFFSTKGEGGTGLGLSTVYGILQQSGGDVSLDSKLGSGTTVTLYLPCTDALVERAVVVADSLEGSGTVLIAEDEELVRQVMRKALEEGGFTLLEAEDGEAALELARQHPGPIDLLCTDAVMPGIPTRELIEGFRALHPNAPVLICSGHVEDAVMRSLLGERQYSTLPKPFTARRLRDEIIDLLGRAKLEESSR